MQVSVFLHYLLVIIALASVLLVALSWFEGALTIWLPRTPESRFWKFFDRLMLTLRYVSASEEKLSRARFALNSITERTNESEK